MKSRNAQGVGIPNPKDAITAAEENILWEKEILGFKDPDTLHNTAFYGWITFQIMWWPGT